MLQYICKYGWNEQATIFDSALPNVQIFAWYLKCTTSLYNNLEAELRGILYITQSGSHIEEAEVEQSHLFGDAQVISSSAVIWEKNVFVCTY